MFNANSMRIKTHMLFKAIKKIKWLVLTGIVMLSVGCGLQQDEKADSIDDDGSRYAVSNLLSSSDTSRYKRAYGDYELRFPADFGSHPDFKTEWWYYTGNLKSKKGRQVGYELTIFRSGLVPDTLEGTSDSDWRTRHLYMAHLALSDIEHSEFYSFERYSRGSAGLAGARAKPFRVWVENWEVRKIKTKQDMPDGVPPMHLSAEAGEIELDLRLYSQKPPVLQGEDGWDRKGPQRGNASYYFSLTRLRTEGEVEIEGERFGVTGNSWMDREWSTSALGEDQAGWDWFALQLTNGEELMYYRLRNKDGTSSPYSSGVIVGREGEKYSFGKDQIQLEPLEYWTSDRSGARYPVRWSLRIPDRNISLTVIPKMKNQELQTRFKYWEGAVRVEGTLADSSVAGEGYVELTGY